MNKIKVFLSFEETYRLHDCLRLLESLNIEPPDIYCENKLFLSIKDLSDSVGMSNAYLAFGYKYGSMIDKDYSANELFYIYLSPEDALLYKLSKP